MANEKRVEIFFDSAPLKNGRYHNGFKWAATDRKGSLIAEGVNSRAEWQIEGEAFGLLRTVEYIEQNRAEFSDQVTIYGDNGTVMGLRFKSKTMAGKYCYIARKKLAALEDDGMTIELACVQGGKNNPADSASRRKTRRTENGH